MDISLASLESCNNFHRFHEELNRVIKMNVIALTFFRLQLDKGISAAEVKDIMYQSEDLWGGMPSWKNPYQSLELASNDLGQNGVVRVFSGFDLFLSAFEGELHSWHSFLHPHAKKMTKEKGETTDADQPDRLFKIVAKNGWTLANEAFIKPIYNYYRLSRNCIAHRNGVASNELSDVSKSANLKSAIANWKTFNTERTPPRIKEVEYGEKIILTHQDAILASSVTRRIALNLGQIVLADIGFEGLVYLAAQKYLLKASELIHPTISYATQYIAFILFSKNRVLNQDKGEIRRALVSMDLLEPCKQKFKKLKS